MIQPVQLSACDDTLIATWGAFSLGFDAQSGNWRWIEGHGLCRRDWVPAAQGSAGVGIHRQPVVPDPQVLLSARTGAGDPLVLTLHIGIGRTTVYRVCEAPRYVLALHYRYDPLHRRLERWLRLTYTRRVDYYGFHQERLTGIWFGLPGFAPASPEQWNVTVAWDRWIPDTALRALLSRPSTAPEGENGFYGLLSAPDHTPGAITLTNYETQSGFTIYPRCEDVPVFPDVFGEQDALQVRHEFGLARRIRDGAEIDAGTQAIAFHATGIQALEVIHNTCANAEHRIRSHWLHRSVIGELFPQVEGGFAGITERAPHLAKAGINTLYLMPITAGGYTCLSQTAISEELGTERQLREMLAVCHAVGLRVLLDFLLTITVPGSALARQHADWLVRDDCGQFLPSVSWGGLSIDWANETYHEHLLHCARRWLGAFGFDGFRIDAPMHKEVNWNAPDGRTPDRTAFGAIRFLHRLRQMIDAEFPNAGLFSEAPGPLPSRHTHLCYDTPAYVMDWLKRGVENGSLHGRDVSLWLAHRLETCRDPGERVVALRTHDFASGFGFQHRSHAALLTTFALLPCAFMMYMTPPPMRAETSVEYRLFAWLVRRRRGQGRPIFLPQRHSPGACAYLSPTPDGATVVVANFSSGELSLTGLADLDLPARAAVVLPFGAVEEQRTPLRLGPYCALVADHAAVQIPKSHVESELR